MRQSLANYIDSGGSARGLVYVITGPLSCEEELRISLADSISSLTGAQMEQKYIKEFVVMNSFIPSGTEYNCQMDGYACMGFFANVTSENGYPPVYIVPLNTGASNVVTQIPNSSLPVTSPSSYAAQSVGAGRTFRRRRARVRVCRALGSGGWKISTNGTNTVNPGTGANTWSSNTASGHYYLTTTFSPARFQSILATPLTTWIPSKHRNQ